MNLVLIGGVQNYEKLADVICEWPLVQTVRNRVRILRTFASEEEEESSIVLL